jgi:hypothetical protein
MPAIRRFSVEVFGMHLHFKRDVLVNDLHDIADAFMSAMTGSQNHKKLATGLRDPSSSARMAARFTLAVNCLLCGKDVYRDVHTIWQRGSPVSIELVDGSCPKCGGGEGFDYSATHSMHA